MTHTYYQVPQLGTSLLTPARAYAYAKKQWSVQYDECRQDADGIQFPGEHGSIVTLGWADLPAPIANCKY